MIGLIISYDELHTCDLYVDAVYEGGSFGNVKDDPLHQLLGVGLQGGFRYRIDKAHDDYVLCVLYSSMTDVDWPDFLDTGTGLFTYFGDNKRPGRLLEETKGNRLLSIAFELAHGDKADRLKLPPFFVFTKFRPEIGRDVVFRGLAVPGGASITSTEDLVAIWRTKNGMRFQNYRSIFTILDVATVSRKWIEDLYKGNTLSEHCPLPYREWVETGQYQALRAPNVRTYRVKGEQRPEGQQQADLIRCLYTHFKAAPYEFEKFAAELVKIMDRNVSQVEVTRRVRDGGRDAIGKYRVGPSAEPIYLDFSLEAKCYDPDNAVGVKEVSRLISRLRHRQFGILITTSFVGKQAYQEIRDDGHPIIIISAKDIAEILTQNGLGSCGALNDWLEQKFPIME